MAFFLIILSLSVLMAVISNKYNSGSLNKKTKEQRKYKILPDVESNKNYILLPVRALGYDGEHFPLEKKIKINQNEIRWLGSQIIEAYSYANHLATIDDRYMVMNASIDGMKEYITQKRMEMSEWRKDVGNLLKFSFFEGDNKDTIIGRIIIERLHIMFKIEGEPVFLGRDLPGDQFFSYYYK